MKRKALNTKWWKLKTKYNIIMLRYITKVECCNCLHLANIIALPEKHMAICNSYLPFAEVPTVGLSSLTTEEDVSNGTRTHKSTLKSTVCTFLVQDTSSLQPLAFRLTDVEGRQYLLGQNDRPYPLITQSLSAPDKSSEKSIITLTVELQGSIPLMEIVQKN